MTTIPALSPTERAIYDREHAALAGVAEPERTAMAMRAVELERAKSSGRMQREARQHNTGRWQGSHRQLHPTGPAEVVQTAAQAAAAAFKVDPAHLAENASHFAHPYRARVGAAKRYVATALAFAFGAYSAADMLGLRAQNVRVMSCELGKHAPSVREKARRFGLELRAAEARRQAA